MSKHVLKFFGQFFALVFVAAIHVIPVYAQSTGESKSAAANTFDIFEFVVEGNTKLTQDQIETAVYPFLGPARSFADVESARDALEKAFQNAGYLTISVDIPEQRADSGAIRLLIAEGTIDRVAVKGAKYFSASEIRAAVPELEAGKVPNANQVRQEITALNKNPNRRVTPSLRPGKTPGTVDVDLNVDDSLPIGGSVAINNFKTATGSTLRLSADLRFENVVSGFSSSGNTLGLSLFTTPENPSETRVFSANYIMPTEKLGTFMAYALSSDSESLEPVGATLVQGKLRLIGLRHFSTLSEASNSRLSLTLGIDRKSNEQLVASPTGEGPIVYYPITIGLNWVLGSSADQWRFDTSLVQGLSSGARSTDAFAKRRLGASPNFSVLKFDLVNDRALSDRLRLKARLGTHLTASPLLNLEQASAGGYDSVRGYFEGEQLGDQSLRTSLEFSYAFTRADSLWRRIEMVGFLEGAKLRVLEPAVGQIDRFSIASIGVGARFRILNSVNFLSEFAYPLKATPQTRKGDWRVLARLSYEY
jgi:hemolysin activation/secretion protein